jgi:subtilisin family serine protease
VRSPCAGACQIGNHPHNARVLPCRRRRLKVLAATAAALAGVAVASGPATAAPLAAKGQLLVGFESSVSKERQEQVLAAVQGRLDRRLGAIRDGRLAVVTPRSGLALAVLRRRLAERPEVAYAEPDYLLSASVATPDDPFYPTQYALGEEPSDYDIDAPEAWATATKCGKVAVLDTGVDLDHPDLEQNIYESKDKPGDDKDNDANGYVDDAHGFNAIKGKGSGNDDNGHGTHVAGIIAGRTNNDVGVSGLCWSAKVVPVKFMNQFGRGATSDAITGIDYAVKQGIKLINCSFGSSAKSEALKDAVKYAKKKGVLLVVAAGNDGEDIDQSPTYPASYGDPNILTVAASTSTDTLASFSNFGSTDVDVAAPGEGILSTYLGGGYKVLSGTSMAAPYVTGLAALLLKHQSGTDYEDLSKAIRKSVDKPPALAGTVATDGRINAAQALETVK